MTGEGEEERMTDVGFLFFFVRPQVYKSRVCNSGYLELSNETPTVETCR